MKFEKFFKSAGTHGRIIKKSEVENWLLCGGVGMRIPTGVNNLGLSDKPEAMFNAIVNSDPDDDGLALKEAVLLDPEGKANDIIRVFENAIFDRIGIYNADYGLLEKKDRISYLEIEVDEDEATEDYKAGTYKFIVVSDHENNVIGFISGTEKEI